MSSIDRLPPLPAITGPRETPLNPKPQGVGGFGETLKDFISDVNQMQHVSAEKTLQFATGEIKDLHEVMAAAEEASISMALLIEIRNKVLEGYKELMRTPV